MTRFKIYGILKIEGKDNLKKGIEKMYRHTFTIRFQRSYRDNDIYIMDLKGDKDVNSPEYHDIVLDKKQATMLITKLQQAIFDTGEI